MEKQLLSPCTGHQALLSSMR